MFHAPRILLKGCVITHNDILIEQRVDVINESVGFDVFIDIIRMLYNHAMLARRYEANQAESYQRTSKRIAYPMGSIAQRISRVHPGK